MNDTTKTTTATSDKLPPPEKEVRADMWPTMTLSQLHHQRDLIVDKLSKLQSMMPFGAAPATVAGLYKALQIALQDVMALIDNKADQKHKIQFKKGP